MDIHPFLWRKTTFYSIAIPNHSSEEKLAERHTPPHFNAIEHEKRPSERICFQNVSSYCRPIRYFATFLRPLARTHRYRVEASVIRRVAHEA